MKLYFKILNSYIDFKICTLFLFISLVYILLNGYWQNLPEAFPYANIVDKAVYSFSIGYIISFIFYILNVLIPRIVRTKEGLQTASWCIRILFSNLRNFKHVITGGKDIDLQQLFDHFSDPSKINERNTFTITNHLGGIIQDTISTCDFIRKVAFITKHTCNLSLQRLNDLDAKFLYALGLVSAGADMVLNTADPNDSSYLSLMNNIEHLIEVYGQEYGVLLDN